MEQAIRDGHEHRERNRGEADWRVYGTRADGQRFAVVYDQLLSGDRSTVRIVILWALRRAPDLAADAHRRYPQSGDRPLRAYYDRDADIAWLPTGDAQDVLSEEVDWGLVDHATTTTDEVVGLEIWSASKRLPKAVLDAPPAPGTPPSAAA